VIKKQVLTQSNAEMARRAAE